MSYIISKQVKGDKRARKELLQNLKNSISDNTYDWEEAIDETASKLSGLNKKVRPSYKFNKNY